MERSRTVVIVPGLAVRSYVEDAAAELRRRGYDVTLLPAPGWRGVPKKLKSYGSQLAGRLDRRRRPIDLLVGLSVGTQAAAVTAAESGTVRNLLLVSPMVDPADRVWYRLFAAWLFRKQEGDKGFTFQLGDWARAGIPRILAGFVSAVDLDLEDVLPAVEANVTIVQPEWNTLSSDGFASGLADEFGARFIKLPRAAHSWPVDDAERFGDLVDQLLGGAR